MRSSVLLATCACAAVVLAVLWFRRDPGRAALPAAGEGLAPAARDGAPMLGGDAAAAPAEAIAPADGSQRRSAAEGLVADAAGDSCRVRVVLASSGAPVPEARLWIEEEQADRALWLLEMRRFNDVEPVLQGGFGQELVLDERGEVRVPPPSRSLCLAASSGELHGEGRLRPEDRECIVELQAYHSLTALVVDRSGRPLENALVALCWGEHDPWQHQWTGLTDARGRAWIPKLEAQLQPEDYRGPLRLTLAAVGCEPEYVGFALEDTPAEPVRLVAGDCGRVVVQLTDAQGTELPLDGFASFEILVESAADLSANLRAAHGVWTRIHGGRALFEHVGLDLSLDVYASGEGHEGAWRWGVRGPLSTGEEVLLRIAVGPREAVARGRVQGIDQIFGASLPRGARLSGEGSDASFSGWLDEDGPFELQVRPAPADAGLGELSGPWTLELYGSGGPLLTLGATPTPNEEDGALDFGNLTFAPPSDLVRVRVLGGGRPFADAMVEVEGLPSRVWCGEGGRCVLDGAPAALPIAIRGTHRDWLPSAWTEVREPGGEHDLELRPGAALAGTLLLPDGGSPDDFALALSIEPVAAGAQAEPDRASLVEGGSFRFAPCEPGRATLAISYGDMPVHERSGIELRAGETTELGSLDLRGELQGFELSFALADGEPWREGALVVREPGGAFSLWLPIGDSGRVRFLSQRPRIDLWAVGRGARATLFEGVSDGQRLLLPRAPSASLRLAPGMPGLEPPLALIVRAERSLPESVEWDPLDYFDGEGEVGSDGTARLEVPWPGTYELAWFVRNAETGVELAVEEAPAQSVEVPEPPALPVVDVPLPLDAVERAVFEAGG